ncbi:MAG: lamin tail domain-containing protein, partial [Bacteroidetes bacterium]
MLFILFFSVSLAFSQTIIISQYTETNSGSSPKGIELWNPTTTDIDFSVTQLDIEQGTNGGTPSNVFSLNTGTLAAGEVLVVGTSDMDVSANCECCSYAEEPFQFNGDDALIIKLNGVITDVFGSPGSDPGSSWSGGGIETRNDNIQLQSGITTGDTDGWTDPSERFEFVAVGSDLTGFGAPTDGCPATTTCEITNFMITQEPACGDPPNDDASFFEVSFT